MRADPDQYTNRWDDPTRQDVNMALLLRLTQAHMKRGGRGNECTTFA